MLRNGGRTSASGKYRGADNKSASYTLAMSYDNMHRIKSKSQHLTQHGVQFNGTLNAGYDLTYTYQDSLGHKFQLSKVEDLNYRTEGAPNEKIDNGHRYLYDANGNLVYINTSRVKKDGKEDEQATEKKYRWDEENRLLASDENGFVASYWYDADGERTVKSSGEGGQVYINSEFSGGMTNTAKFSLYVSPYLVASQGGRYTKHIYIGSQRIVSKLGDLASYGADPRRIPYAGTETDGITVDYQSKYNRQQQAIKDNYADFGVPYDGEDNNDYVNGQGFCCNDVAPTMTKAKAARAIDGNFKPNDDYERLQFYYHPDHLGSSSYITNLDGEVVQHIEYVPFGEVFIEERNNTWNTPYLFNAKEYDEETGMYYYGARYYEPRISLWMSVDPLSEKSPNTSSYLYCFANPIKYIDPIGLDSVYWGQNGEKLYTFGTDTKETKNYVVKTTMKTNEMYEDSNMDQKGKSNPITQSEYEKTVEEIKNGILTSPNIVYIGTSKRLRAMLENIKDDGTGGTSDNNNREYSGDFKGSEIVNFKTGKVQDPLRGNAITYGNPSFHSHPSGTKYFIFKGDRYKASWQQPPSKQDINTANKTQYVVGMANGIVYRYDKSGVHAIFPISIIGQ